MDSRFVAPLIAMFNKVDDMLDGFDTVLDNVCEIIEANDNLDDQTVVNILTSLSKENKYSKQQIESAVCVAFATIETRLENYNDTQIPYVLYADVDLPAAAPSSDHNARYYKLPATKCVDHTTKAPAAGSGPGTSKAAVKAAANFPKPKPKTKCNDHHRVGVGGKIQHDNQKRDTTTNDDTAESQDSLEFLNKAKTVGMRDDTP